MERPLRVLILEDRPEDAELMARQLSRAGYDLEWRCVATREDFAAHCGPDVDLILADYVLPNFSAPEALRILRERGLDIPFIVVTGSVGEETAVECMHRGAADYVLKQNLTRLAPSVERALERKRLREERRQAMRALGESEQRFRLLFEEAPIAYQSLDESGRLLEVNRAWLELLGYADKGEVIGRPFAEFLAPEDRARFPENFARFKAVGRVTNVEYTVRRKDGSHIRAIFDGTIGRDEQGRFRQTHCTVRDITEQRRAEQALRESEAELRTVFDSAADLITLADMETGVYLDANQGFLEATGYTREEVIGKTGEALGLWCDLARRHEIVRRLSQGEEVRNEEITFRKKDGTPLVALLTAEIVQVGGRPCLLCVARDITERERMQEEMEERRLFLENVLACAPDAIIAMDREARVVAWNAGAEALFGYTSDEALGKHIDELVAGADPSTHQEALKLTEQLLRGEPVTTSEMVRFRKDGSPVTVIAAGAPVTMRGAIVGIVAAYTDITERKRMEQALRESERRFRELFERMPSGVVVYTAVDDGADFVIKEFNSAAERIEGARREDLLGKRVTKAFPGVEEFGLLRILRDVWQSGNEAFYPEAVYTDETGRKTWRENWVYKLPNGDIVAIYNDITERKRAEEKIRESEETYRNLFQNAQVGLYRTRIEDGKILESNEQLARMFGYDSREEFVREYVTSQNYVDPGTRERMLEQIRRDGYIQNFEARFYRKDRSIFWARYSARIYPDKGWIEGVSEDITEAKMAEEALRRRTEELMTLNRLGVALAETLDLPRIYHIARECVAELVDAPVFGISLYDPETHTLRAEAMWSNGMQLDPAEFPPLSLPPAAEATRGRAKAVATGRPEVVESLPDAAAQSGETPHHIGPPGNNRKTLSAAYVPMVVEGKVIGLLEVQSYRAGAYGDAEIALLQPVANQIGLAIQNARLFQQVSRRAAELAQSLEDLKQAQEALRASEARFRSLVESMDDIVFTLDREGRHTGVFGRWLERYGTPAEVYLGKAARDILGPEAARVHEEANARVLAGEHVVYDWFTDGPNGRVYVQTSLSPLLGPDGQVVGIVGVGRDITALKRMEQALRESEARYRSLVNLSPDGMWVHRGGEVLFANAAAAAMLGVASPDELIGKRILDFVAPEYREIAAERIRRGQEERVPAPLLEEKLLRVDGSEFWADVCAVPIDWAGEPAVQVIVRDITERKRMEERLLQAQKMEVVGRLAGGVAHDFNNILTAMTGYATFVLEALPPGAPEREDVQQILDLTQRAANLTRQLLAFSRRQIIEQRVINLNDLILNLDKMLRRLIGEDIELVVLPGEGLARVKADAGQIEQVIVNLAVNARDAMPEGGKLIIQTANVTVDEQFARIHLGSEPGAYVMLSVTDTGVGMTDEVKAHLFEPFFTTKEPGKGTGLGLATVYGIVKQHGGNIHADSEPGKGTTFTIYLPAVEAEAERLPRRDEEGFIPGGKETVLVVEDEALVRAALVRTLKEQGYRVLEAANGEEALHIAREHAGEIHLLLTDVVMPQMGGKELSERIAAIHPRIKTLFVSGYTDDAMVQRGILEPGIAFLHKPFTAGALARKVRQVLDMD